MRLLTLLFILTLFVEPSFCESTTLSQFEKFKQKERREFLAYKKRQEEEFESYKKILSEEFKRYKDEIAKFWEDRKTTDKKVWVEYSSDLKMRRVVNFETGEVEISVIDNNTKEASKKLTKSLKDLLVEDKQTAYKRDTLSNRIEKRLTTSFSTVKRSDIKREKILTPIFFKEKPTPKRVEQKVNTIIATSKKEIRKNRNNQTVYTIKFKMPSNALLQKSRQYKPTVTAWANRRELPPELIFAIIHTESSFNPMARSPIPAYGLMQIVPYTAGKDVTKFLYGKPKLLAPSYLYNANKNIAIGSTYFYMLYHKYLSGVKDPKSRLYCSICAYNGGIGRVIKAFTGATNLKRGAQKINSLDSNEVYRVLMRRMPEETRDYLKRVLKRMEIYKHI